MQYAVVIKKSKEGYAVWCPCLPGCASQGETKSEALANIKSAITDYVAVALSNARKRGSIVKVRVAA